MYTNPARYFWTIALISLGVLSGCGTNSGTDPFVDAMKDAVDDALKDPVEFSKSRIDELEQELVRTTVQQSDGKWVSQRKEIRNARAGMTGQTNPANQKHEFEVKIEYEFRIFSSKPFDAKAEAEAAEIPDQDAAWEATTETYIREGDNWVLTDAP